MIDITRRLEAGPDISDDLTMLVADLFKYVSMFVKGSYLDDQKGP